MAMSELAGATLRRKIKFHFSLQQDSSETKKKVEEGDKGRKTGETRIKKKGSEKIYHMCFDCRKGIFIVE